MKKFAILVGLMALALVIGVTGSTFRADKAQARATDIVAFNQDICANVVVVDQLSNTDKTPAQVLTEAVTDCYATGAGTGGLYVAANLEDLAGVLEGDVDVVDTYKDLADLSDAQLGQDGSRGPGGQAMWVLTFVTNADPTDLEADEGGWLSQTPPKATAIGLHPVSATDLVVVDMLIGKAIPDSHRGTATLTATQGVNSDVASLDYTVVGMPDELTLKATKDTIQQTAGDKSSEDVCKLPGLLDFTAFAGIPSATGLLATVVDDDGTELTGVPVLWDSEKTDKVDLSSDQMHPAGDQYRTTATISSGGAVAAPDLGCGDGIGESKITASVDNGAANPPDDKLTVTVVGIADSMTLAANPTMISCDGVTNAVVTATILGADGKPVVAGNSVRFEVVALGTADPITGQTDDKGVASSKITPLSGPLAGVTVLATVLESAPKVDDNGNFSGSSTVQTDIQGSILVNCQQTAPTAAPPPPVATPNVRIGGPNTGDGGYLP